ncbi:hypothetical protein ILYODFUR_026488 [Ilyodon furcidens]|uniref:Uncharacterized protein n=1 Tax=Ilyodon furcidens TaxID=33524 RepID=A0ABV0T439_9TELE
MFALTCRGRMYEDLKELNASIILWLSEGLVEKIRGHVSQKHKESSLPFSPALLSFRFASCDPDIPDFPGIFQPFLGSSGSLKVCRRCSLDMPVVFHVDPFHK